MATINKSIDIDAPAERVFAILTDPKRLPEYAPGVTSVEDIRYTEQHLGDSFRATYAVLGLHFPMTFTVTEHEPPTKRTTRFEGGMKGAWTWRLSPRGKSTHLTTAMEYEMAGGILGKAMNAVLVERMNEKNAERLLENLKLVSEVAPSRVQGSVCIIKPSQFDSNTPQTPGMQRMAAISRELAGSQGIWGGVTIVAPNTASGMHHHGEIETIIYVVSGHGKMRWGEKMEFEQEVEPGDFIYVPPFVPHQEINPSPDTPSQWVIVRNAQEPIVVNLEPLDAPQKEVTR